MYLLLKNDYFTAQKMEFSAKDFFRFSSDLVTFTEEISKYLIVSLLAIYWIESPLPEVLKIWKIISKSILFKAVHFSG